MGTKKKTVVSEVASVLGAAAARVESIKPKRAALKHAKAKPAVQTAKPVAKETEQPMENETVTPEPVIAQMPEHEEIALNAYLYFEARGFQGGSPEEDWIRAEQEVRRRRS